MSPLSLLCVFLGLSSAVPGLHPSVPCVATSPTLRGYPVIVAQSLGIESCQVSPSTLGPFQVPRWGSQPREVREVGKGTQILNVALSGTVPETPDTWAVASLWGDTQARLAALLPALWVTLACPLRLRVPSLRP